MSWQDAARAKDLKPERKCVPERMTVSLAYRSPVVLRVCGVTRVNGGDDADTFAVNGGHFESHIDYDDGYKG